MGLFHFILFCCPMYLSLTWFQMKTKYIPRKQWSRVGKVLLAACPELLCEQLSDTYLGHVSSTHRLVLTFARPETHCFFVGIRRSITNRHTQSSSHNSFQRCHMDIIRGKWRCPLLGICEAESRELAETLWRISTQFSDSLNAQVCIATTLPSGWHLHGHCPLLALTTEWPVLCYMGPIPFWYKGFYQPGQSNHLILQSSDKIQNAPLNLNFRYTVNNF